MEPDVQEQLVAFQRQLKSLQKQLRTVIRFGTELESRLEASDQDAHSPKEGTANDRTTSRAEAPELVRR
jgi:hypothetical protein